MSKVEYIILTELVDAPVSVIKGVSAGDAKVLAETFNIKFVELVLINLYD